MNSDREIKQFFVLYRLMMVIRDMTFDIRQQKLQSVKKLINFTASPSLSHMYLIKELHLAINPKSARRLYTSLSSNRSIAKAVQQEVLLLACCKQD